MYQKINLHGKGIKKEKFAKAIRNVHRAITKRGWSDVCSSKRKSRTPFDTKTTSNRSERRKQTSRHHIVRIVCMCVCVCDTDRVGVWKMRITIDRRERLPRVHVKGNGDSSCDDDGKLCRQPLLRYVWPASLFRWKQNDSKPRSRTKTTIVPEVFHVFETVYFVALNAIVTSSLLHFTFPPTFQRPARNRSARTSPKRDETIFISGNEILVIAFH